jgi:hypothetical protein
LQLSVAGKQFEVGHQAIAVDPDPEAREDLARLRRGLRWSPR